MLTTVLAFRCRRMEKTWAICAGSQAFSYAEGAELIVDIQELRPVHRPGRHSDDHQGFGLETWDLLAC